MATGHSCHFRQCDMIGFHAQQLNATRHIEYEKNASSGICPCLQGGNGGVSYNSTFLSMDFFSDIAGGNPYKPSLFELIAQEQLRDLLQPALKYVLTVRVSGYIWWRLCRTQHH